MNTKLHNFPNPFALKNMFARILRRAQDERWKNPITISLLDQNYEQRKNPFALSWSKGLFLLIIFTLFINPFTHATIDDTQGFYQPGNPTFPYLNYGSSYYYNPGDDFYWTGKEWIFESGYKIPNRCKKNCNFFTRNNRIRK